MLRHAAASITAIAFALTLGAVTVHSGPDDGATVAHGTSYAVKVKVPGPVAKDTEAVAYVTVKAANGWHVNQEFPTKLTIDPPADVEVDKTTQRQSDAVRHDDHQATFAIKYKGSSAGKKAFTGKLKFAVCTADTCDPKKVDLAFAVEIE